MPPKIDRLAEFLANVTLTGADGKEITPGAKPLTGPLTLRMRPKRLFAGDREATLASLHKANPEAKITWAD